MQPLDENKQNHSASDAAADAVASAIVEDALRSLPRVEAPPELFQAVMAQVYNHPRVSLPVFRLRWMDFVLSLFFAGMIGIAMTISMVSGLLPPDVLMYLDWQLRWFHAMQLDWLFLSALFLSILVCASAVFLFSSQNSGWKLR